jgi:hypothetical protein
MRLRPTASLLLTTALGAAPAFAQGNPDLSDCQRAIAAETSSYVRSVTKSVDKCLTKMSALVVKKGTTPAAAAVAIAEYCAGTFAPLASTGELGARFEANIAKHCDVADDAALGAANLGEYCEAFGGDETVSDRAEWLDCLRAAGDAQARDAIATRWPRALEWFSPLATSIDPGAALTALVALDAAIEGPVEDNKPDASTQPALLNTGARQCILGGTSSILLGSCPRGPLDQDGIAQAGYEPGYTDNGDGTITDEVTGLTWEKLGDDGSVHDQSDTYTLTDGINMKIAALNAGSGFAGHTDWRLPNRRELDSIVDSGIILPSVRSVFHEECSPGCSALTCSCTEATTYWTSTAYQPDPSKNWIVEFDHGLIRAIAASDVARVRAVRGGANLAASSPPGTPDDNAAGSLVACQKAVAKGSARYVRKAADTVGKCLGHISAQVIGKNGTPAAAAQTAGGACVAALQKLVNTGAPDKQLASKFEAKVGKKCDPAVNPKLRHVDADTWTIGDRTLAAANLDAYCAALGGDGRIEAFAEWRNCVRAAAEAEAREAITLRWPRALEYFAALGIALTAAPAGPETGDALAALASLDGPIEGATDDDLPEPPPPSPAWLLQTGQTQCVQNDATFGTCPGGRPDQDGELQLGIPRSYTDNGDGTITDLVTGLMWEKLSDDDSIHDRDHEYYQQGAHHNKLNRLNRHSFAGYTDWRVPNRRELESLIDAGRVNPAIDPIFNQDCTPGCSNLTCSCTASEGYRSSTYVSLDSGLGVGAAVRFDDGSVFSAKTEGDPNFFGGNRVRAVRAGNVPATTVEGQPPVAYDLNFTGPAYFNSCQPLQLAGDDPDSALIFVELVTFPTNGFLAEYSTGQNDPPGQTPISARVPDTGPWWVPYDYQQQLMGGGGANPRSSTYCWVSFSSTFTGTDSFTFLVRDIDGNTSNVALVTLTIFDEGM